MTSHQNGSVMRFLFFGGEGSLNATQRVAIPFARPPLLEEPVTLPPPPSCASFLVFTCQTRRRSCRRAAPNGTDGTADSPVPCAPLPTFLLSFSQTVTDTHR